MRMPPLLKSDHREWPHIGEAAIAKLRGEAVASAAATDIAIWVWSTGCRMGMVRCAAPLSAIFRKPVRNLISSRVNAPISTELPPRSEALTSSVWGWLRTSISSRFLETPSVFRYILPVMSDAANAASSCARSPCHAVRVNAHLRVGQNASLRCNRQELRRCCREHLIYGTRARGRLVTPSLPKKCSARS
jgi:hypothetical protein